MAANILHDKTDANYLLQISDAKICIAFAGSINLALVREKKIGKSNLPTQVQPATHTS